MKQQIKRLLTLFSFMIMLLVTGCTSQKDMGIITGTDLKTNDSVANRFAEGQGNHKTVVESAVELSDKYARLTDQAAQLHVKNQALAKENEELQRQKAVLETKLKEAESELSAANGLLIEMVSELNDWKASVMGFRSEMRQAAAAQLQALIKVMESLGVDTEIKDADSSNLSLQEQKFSGVSAHGGK